MDEKTEELREVFRDISDRDTVTDVQERERGTISRDDDVHEDLRTAISTMREDLDFRTDLSEEQLVRVVSLVFQGLDDADIAAQLDGVTPATVADARLDLHLLRPSDADFDFDLNALREVLSPEHSPDEDIAARFDTTPADIRRARRVLTTRAEIRRVNDRYHRMFERLLRDSDLGGQLTRDGNRHGLSDALEGQEVDLDL